MAIPRVFVSSTFYDLKHIRESLKYFIGSMGYDPVLSEEGDVFYDPSTHTHNSCLKEVATCQIFVLVIGGRYGGKFQQKDTSITNHEYREAVKHKIPVFALVESSVYSDHHVYTKNLKDRPELVKKIAFPSADNTKIFEFIDEVRSRSANNAIVPFRDFTDIEAYLRKQWAGMMYDFLTVRSQEEGLDAMNRLLGQLTQATRRSEELIKVLYTTTGDEGASSKIESISRNIKAESFATLILEAFHVEQLDVEVKQPKSTAFDGNWVEFLEEVGDFYVEKILQHDGIHEVLFPMQESYGVLLEHRSDGEDASVVEYPKIEEAYAALKQADPEVQIRVLQRLAGELTSF